MSIFSRCRVNMLCGLMLVILNYIGKSYSASEPSLKVTSPLNPVEENGILSLHCQVWNLQPLYEVTVSRKVGGVFEKLFVDDIAFTESDDMFLAERQLIDGSTVFFLTIMNVGNTDRGRYTCKVVNKEDNQILRDGFIDFEITHFPVETDPICSPYELVTARVGEEIELSCNSEIANPQVELTWTKSGEPIGGDIQTYEQNGRIYSVLRYRITLKDKGDIIQCEVTSLAFPDKIQSCHVGPLHIEFNPDFVVTGVVPLFSSKPMFDIDNDSGNGVVSSGGTRKVFGDAKCSELCSSTSSPLFYWIMTTIVAAIVALIFFILGITLLIRYYRITNEQDTPYGSVMHHSHKDGIYSELEHRRNDNKVYMTLEKGDKVLQKVQINRTDPLGHYETAPTMPKF